MRLDHLPHGRLTGAVLVGLTLALAVLIVAARGATTTSESYYLALGDSITYGLQPTKAKPGARPSDFKTGYVDVVAARLRKRSSNLDVVNYGCPGESTVTFTRGRCPAFADRIKLHDVFSGSQLGAALAFLCMIITLACSSDEKGTGALAEGCHINTDCSSPLVTAYAAPPASPSRPIALPAAPAERGCREPMR